VFSAGCHSGYNLLDGEALPGVALELDWAQAFAQKQAILVAGTGYQYGDTDFLEYSERLYRNFARELRAGGDGTAVSVGEALVRAKVDYLATTPDIRGIHEKALLESTLFGLPMFGVTMPKGRGATTGGGGALTPTPVPDNVEAPTGLAVADLSVDAALIDRSVALENAPYDGTGGTTLASWLEGPDGVVTNPAEPAIPLDAVDVSSTDPTLVLRGVGFRGGDYEDRSSMTPLTGAATTELRGVHVPFLSPVFYPMRLGTPNYFGELAGSGGTNLLVTRVQHRADNVAQGTSTERRFDDLDVKLFYSKNVTAAALSDAPSIVAVDARTVGSNVVFTAQVVGDPAAGLHQVWVTWTAGPGSTGEGSWASLDLQQCVAPLPAVCGGLEDSRIWKASMPSLPNVEFVVQAANGLGLVAFDDNRGSYYRIVGEAAPAPVTTSLTIVSAPTSASFGQNVTVEAKFAAPGTAPHGRSIAISAGGSTRYGTTDVEGTVSLQMPVIAAAGTSRVTASYGGSTTELPSSAATSMTVVPAATILAEFPAFVTKTASTGTGVITTLSAQLDGKTQPLMQQSVTLQVTGPVTRTVSAITNYLGQASLPKDLPTGTYTVVASFAGDVTYAATSRSGSLAVAPFTGFFAPVNNPPLTNVAKIGSTIPVKFSLGGNRGQLIFAAGFPKAVPVACAVGAIPDTIEEYASSTGGLQYDATADRYTYPWRTTKSMKGCYTLEMRFVDGSTYSARFHFK
jgi:hypothetical protein